MWTRARSPSLGRMHAGSSLESNGTCSDVSKDAGGDAPVALQCGFLRRTNVIRSLAVAALASCTGFSCVAHAADAGTYPTKPVRIIVAVAPGGGVDIQTRLFSQKVSESLNRAFVVENRPSA